MEVQVLKKLFGLEEQWHGPCTVILDAEAGVQALGVDSIIGGGAKTYAPRMISGRLATDAIALLRDGSALMLIQHHRVRLNTGEDITKQNLVLVDPLHVVAVEFTDTSPLLLLGISPPASRPSTGSHQGTMARPV